MTGILERVVLPVADPEDGRSTARSFRAYADENDRVVVVHVVEKAGGAPDKASVEQREEYAEETFAAVHDELDGVATVETRVAFGTDVAETIFDVAADVDATAIAFSPRGGSRWVRMLTGDVALDLVTGTDRPVVVLPDDTDDD